VSNQKPKDGGGLIWFATKIILFSPHITLSNYKGKLENNNSKKIYEILPKVQR
jgi:hypothetical protein